MLTNNLDNDYAAYYFNKNIAMMYRFSGWQLHTNISNVLTIDEWKKNNIQREYKLHYIINQFKIRLEILFLRVLL